MSGPLAGRVIIITGGAGGIGGGIARALASGGARLVLVDLDGVGAEQASAAIRADGGMAEGLQVDVTDRDQVFGLVERVTRLHGRLDQYWNNAGLVQVGPLLEISAAEWRRVFAVNVEGALFGAQAAIKQMLTQPLDPDFGYRGKLVSVSSGAAERGRPMLAAYGASKAALNHLTKSVVEAHAIDGICAAILYPTSVMEGMWKVIDPTWGALEGLPPGEMARRRAADSPTGKFQSPDEVGAIARYVALSRGQTLSGKIIYTEAAVVDA